MVVSQKNALTVSGGWLLLLYQYRLGHYGVVVYGVLISLTAHGSAVIASNVVVFLFLRKMLL